MEPREFLIKKLPAFFFFLAIMLQGSYITPKSKSTLKEPEPCYGKTTFEDLLCRRPL